MNEDIRNELPADQNEDKARLERIRNRIAAIDLTIADALARRMDCVEEIIGYKKEHGMIIFQGDQEKKQRKVLRERVAGHKYEDEILDVYQEIIKSIRKVQARSLFSYNIMLIGFMGSGKTTVADYLGRMLEMEHVDTDEMIVNWMGMSISDIVKRCTENPGNLMNGKEKPGTLSKGALADVAVFSLENHAVTFSDTSGAKRTGNKLFRPVLTLCKGEIVYRDMTF